VKDFSLYFGANLLIAENAGKILYVEFLPIDRGSLGEKAGLRSGDHLIAVEGQEVKGLTRESFEKLFLRTADATGFLHWRFTIERGEKKVRSILRLSVKAEQGTAAKTEPRKTK
jgi:C-terminal processing protease CtpA/Prc